MKIMYDGYSTEDQFLSLGLEERQSPTSVDSYVCVWIRRAGKGYSTNIKKSQGEEIVDKVIEMIEYYNSLNE